MDIALRITVSHAVCDLDSVTSQKIGGTRARAKAADKLAVETMTIADSMADSNPQRDVQRIRTRQWLAERWDQKTYGLQKAQQININVQDLRMAALRHVEVIDDLSTEKSA